MPKDDRAPKQGTALPDKAEKQAAAHQAVDILHEISTILVRAPQYQT
jgi:mitotic-spindle organizing protein 1